MHYTLSRLSLLDVNWANLYDANGKQFHEFHQNPYYQLILIAEGPVHLQTENERLTLSTGDTLLLMPWEKHKRWNPKEQQGKFFWVQFSCEPTLKPVSEDEPPLPINRGIQSKMLPPSFGKIEEPIVFPRYFQTGLRYKLMGAFEELIEVLNKPKGYFRLHATLLLGEILRLLANDYLEQSQTNTAFPASYVTLRKLLNHLNNNYTSKVSKAILEKVAERKYAYLCQIFKKYTGTTIHNYVHQLRIQQAKHILVTTDHTIREISQSVGYEDQFHFSQLFKKHIGVAPQHFRHSNGQTGF